MTNDVMAAIREIHELGFFSDSENDRPVFPFAVLMEAPNLFVKHVACQEGPPTNFAITRDRSSGFREEAVAVLSGRLHPRSDHLRMRRPPH